MLLILLAGLCAGGVTGFFGGSATLVVVLLLVTFSDYHPYAAIRLALAIDIFSSMSAFRIYNHRTAIHLKSALPLIVFVIIRAALSSIIASRTTEIKLNIIIGLFLAVLSVTLLTKSLFLK